MRIQFVLIIVLLFFLSKVALTQNYYRLINGPVLITWDYGDSIIMAESNSLNFIFNYLTNEVNFNLPINSLKSNNSQIDSLLKLESGGEILFKGKIIGEYDASKEHPPLVVDVEGNLEYENIITPLFFNATLTHLNAGSASCNFSATLSLEITKYFEDIEIMALDNVINIIFNELILYKIE